MKLFQEILLSKFTLGFLENLASEQGSRMTAMDNATRNANDMIDNLNIIL